MDQGTADKKFFVGGVGMVRGRSGKMQSMVRIKNGAKWRPE